MKHGQKQEFYFNFLIIIQHWQCLDMNNQDFWPCRDQEKVMNACGKIKN